MKKLLLLALAILSMLPWTFAQEEGTADYTLMYFPQFKSLLPEEVKETSGLFFHNGKLWTHNDSGGKPILYALDTTTFEVVQRVTLTNARFKDWEDVCTDDERVYVGDFGNNKGKRKNLRVYTFPLSELPQEGDASVTVDSITFRFADQTEFNFKKHEHDYDCESIFAGDSCLYLFAKCWATGTTRLYRLPKTPGDYTIEVVNGFNSQGLITGADYDRKNHVLVVVGYVKDIWMPFMYLIYDFDEAGVKLSHRRIEMPQLTGAQTEGICFFKEGLCYLSSETSPTMHSSVYVVDFRKWIDEALNKKR